MNRDELMQLPNVEVAFVMNVWSSLGCCYDKHYATGQVQYNENPRMIVINVA